jgi:hypothetical protein
MREDACFFKDKLLGILYGADVSYARRATSRPFPDIIG